MKSFERPKMAEDNLTHLTSRKRVLFAAITISIPFVLLVLLEVSLRLFNYGHDLSLFKAHEIRHQIYYQMNPDVKFRYFGNSRFSPSTSPDYFQMPKPKGVYRIFCLGGSTTVGYPYLFNGSFASFLRDRLAATFPQKKIEVINLGMTAVNSYTVLDIVSELGKYQPDLIIDYDGHNEFYGALGAASNQTVGSSRFITLLYLRLVHLKTFQLLQNGIRWVSGIFAKDNNSISRGTEMEMMARGQYVPFGSPVYNAAYSIFRENLEVTKDYCRDRNIPLIIGTQVSDLKDQPPFISENLHGLSDQQKFVFENFFEAGITFQTKQMFDSAAAAFHSAIAIDSQYAYAHYRLAECLDSLGKKRDAFRQYVLARDYDELRFRTDSKFNDLIRSMDDRSRCFVADIETSFESLSPDSLIGHNFITEHLHPNSRGNFLIAKEYAQIMRGHGLLGTRREWLAFDTLNENRLWEDRSVTVLDERIAMYNTTILTSGWPFKNQMPSDIVVPTEDTLGQIARKVAINKLDWTGAHEEAINFYRRRGDLGDVEREYKVILSEFPLDLELYLDLAKVYLAENRLDKMEATMKGSLDVYPTIQAYRTLGDIMMQRGDAADAAKYYENMDNFRQDSQEKIRNSMALSYAYVKCREFQKAKERLVEILSTAPDFKPAAELLRFVNMNLNANMGLHE